MLRRKNLIYTMMLIEIGHKTRENSKHLIPIAARHLFNFIIDFIRIRDFSTREWIYFNRWFSSFNSLCREACFSTALLGFTLNTFQLGQVSLDRVEEIFQKNPIILDKPNTKFLKRKIKGFLEAKDLTIKYPGSKFNSLNGLNFKVYPGELIAIVGPVGCGKTTLAKCLGRTIEIPEGQLF